MRPTYDVTRAVELAPLDDLRYDITLEATDLGTGVDAPLTTGTVTAHVSAWPPTLTPLPSSGATLAHLTGGRWIGSRDVTEMAVALTGIRAGTPLAIVYVVDGAMARYREAVAVTMRRSEAG
jgi:hypothetical protein